MGQKPAPWSAGEAGPPEGDLRRLVERIEGGERAAEAELVERFGRGLRLLLLSLAQNHALAEDLHQELLTLAIEKIRRGEVREPERLAGFLRSTARNLFLANRRKAARYRPLRIGGGAGGGGEGEEGEGSEPLLADRGPAPLDRLISEEEAREVRRLLGELRFARDRELLFRFYLADDSRVQICADLGLDPERFNQVLHRARERLREICERSEKRRRFFSGVRGFIGKTNGLLALVLG